MAVSSLGLAQDPLAPETPTPPADPPSRGSTAEANPPPRRPPRTLQLPKRPAPAAAKPPLADPTQEADPTLLAARGRGAVRCRGSEILVLPRSSQARTSATDWHHAGTASCRPTSSTTPPAATAIPSVRVWSRAKTRTKAPSVVFKPRPAARASAWRSTRTAIGGVTPSAVIEVDFAGDQPTSDTGSSERSYYDSPSLAPAPRLPEPRQRLHRSLDRTDRRRVRLAKHAELGLAPHSVSPLPYVRNVGSGRARHRRRGGAPGAA